MRKSVDFFEDDHPPDAEDDDRVPTSWIVAVADDCDACGDIRVEVTLEEVGRPGTGVTAHLGEASARRLRAALAAAMRDGGFDPGL